LRQSVFLAGQLTVFRNIDYFRRYFAAKYQPQGKKVAEHVFYPASTWSVHPSTPLLIITPGHRFWDERYGIWHALRHPAVTLMVDCMKQVSAFGDQTKNGL
jgi:hypothetical protein